MGRRGQSSTEYLLLLCSVVMVTALVGGFVQKYIPQILAHLLDLILSTALEMARPY